MCPEYKNGSTQCGRDKEAIPKTVEIRNTQRVLLITRDPSNQANRLADVTGYENIFFRDKVLSILFAEYESKEAKNNKKYFETYKELFLNLVYWTHYQKCFPGTNQHGHKQPNNLCVEKYLSSEIEACEPEIIICVGSHAIKYVTGEKKLLDAIQKNGKNTVNVAGKQIPVICLTHPSNANMKSKSDPSYKYEETVKLIHEVIVSSRKKTH